MVKVQRLMTSFLRPTNWEYLMLECLKCIFGDDIASYIMKIWNEDQKSVHCIMTKITKKKEYMGKKDICMEVPYLPFDTWYGKIFVFKLCISKEIALQFMFHKVALALKEYRLLQTKFTFGTSVISCNMNGLRSNPLYEAEINIGDWFTFKFVQNDLNPILKICGTTIYNLYPLYKFTPLFKHFPSSVTFNSKTIGQ